jgi:hypothetical protein
VQDTDRHEQPGGFPFTKVEDDQQTDQKQKPENQADKICFKHRPSALQKVFLCGPLRIFAFSALKG